MNDQREIIYGERRRVLDGESMRDSIIQMIENVVEAKINMVVRQDANYDSWDLNELNELLLNIFPIQPITINDVKGKKASEFIEEMKTKMVKLYEEKEKEFPSEEEIREIERVFLLKVIDLKWMDHIDNMELLRQGISMQAYGQKDPLVEYRNTGFDMFDEMTAAIQEEIVKLLLHIKVEQKVEREQVAKVTGTNKDDTGVRAPKKREAAKIYPNDPCPCGSGKKYKQCCGRLAQKNKYSIELKPENVKLTFPGYYITNVNYLKIIDGGVIVYTTNVHGC